MSHSRFIVCLVASACCAAIGAPQESDEAGVEFTVTFEPPLDEPFVERIPALAETLSPDADRPRTVAALRRRASRDVERFQRLLRSEGHYGNNVSFSIDEENDPIELQFHVEPGKAYRLAKIAFEMNPPTDAIELPAPPEIGLVEGEPARAEPIVSAEGALVDWLRNRGYPFAKAGEREAIVDHAKKTMDLVMRVDTGIRATYGDARVEGLQHVEEEAVLQRLPWDPGDLFAQRQLNEARRSLLTSELFTLASLEPVNEPDETGAIPIRIRVSEREHRTIAAGLDFTSDLGLGVELLWEHRNLARLGRRFTADARISRDLRSLQLTYRQPFAGADNRTFIADSEIAFEDSDAFDSRRIVLKGVYETRLNPQWTFDYGLGLRVSRTEQRRREETYSLFSVITEWMRDTRDDTLNPTAGSRLAFGVVPYLSIDDFGSGFLGLELDYSTYFSLDAEDDWVLALRTRVGSYLGSSVGDVPPDIRFYAGGGGSVRGVPFRTASPLDRDDDPIGGRSVWEGSVELRRRINETFGVVAFVDIGSAFNSALPDFDPSPRVGVGAGLRIFTAVGPIGVDLAVPVSRRDVDDAFQIYLSVGQAF